MGGELAVALNIHHLQCSMHMSECLECCHAAEVKTVSCESMAPVVIAKSLCIQKLVKRHVTGNALPGQD